MRLVTKSIHACLRRVCPSRPAILLGPDRSHPLTLVAGAAAPVLTSRPRPTDPSRRRQRGCRNLRIFDAIRRKIGIVPSRAAYVEGWSKVLVDDKKSIFRAAGAAQAAADFTTKRCGKAIHLKTEDLAL